MVHRRGHNDVTNFVSNAVDNNCCAFWTNGCGLNPLFSSCTVVLESITPLIEQLGNVICIFGSPLAFPIIFCFTHKPHTNESSGYEISILQSCYQYPITCCFTTLCCPCAQWYTRKRVLHNDMTKYKLWQGYYDGPQCCARSCKGAPITIKSGTYGEQKCPNLFLCLEVCCLGGLYSICCAFDVTRKYQRNERGLNLDPTEQRQHKCIHCFSQIMHTCIQCGCCFCMSGWLVKVCATDSSHAQECAGECGRTGRALCRIGHIIWKGIIWTRIITMGCMTTQMIVEASVPYDKATQGPKQKPQFLIHEDDDDDDPKHQPIKNEMMDDRGDPNHKPTSTNEYDGPIIMELESDVQQQQQSNPTPDIHSNENKKKQQHQQHKKQPNQQPKNNNKHPQQQQQHQNRSLDMNTNDTSTAIPTTTAAASMTTTNDLTQQQEHMEVTELTNLLMPWETLPPTSTNTS